jgi:membrane protease YdiL (CAAX protease family)
MEQSMVVVVIVVVATIVLTGMYQFISRGRWRASGFDGVPPRGGSMHMGDTCIAVGVWMLSMIVGVMIAGPSDPDASPGATLHAMLAGSVGGLIGAMLLLVRAGTATSGGLAGFGLGLGRFVKSLPATLGVMVFIIAATFATLAAASWVSKAMGIEPPDVAHDTLIVLMEASPGVRLGIIAVAVLLAPVVEEIVFRGMFQTALLQSRVFHNRWPILLIGSALFALVHVEVAYQAKPGLFVLAMGLGYVYERTGSLWAPITIHAVFNATNIALVLAGLGVD